MTVKGVKLIEFQEWKSKKVASARQTCQTADLQGRSSIPWSFQTMEPVGERHDFPAEEEKLVELWEKIDAFKVCPAT